MPGKNDSISLLCAHPFFAGLDPALLRPRQEALQLRRIEPSQIVVHRDETDQKVYFVIDGLLLAALWTRDGREIAYSKLTAGMYFGELAALDKGPRSLSVYALKPSTIIVMSEAFFRELIGTYPIIRDRLILRLTQLIRELTKRHEMAIAQPVEIRVRQYLGHLALESGVTEPGGELSDLPVQREIAASIGASREAVSRVFADLKRDKVIAMKGRKLTLLNPGELIQSLSA